MCRLQPTTRKTGLVSNFKKNWPHLFLFFCCFFFKLLFQIAALLFYDLILIVLHTASFVFLCTSACDISAVHTHTYFSFCSRLAYSSSVILFLSRFRFFFLQASVSLVAITNSQACCYLLVAMRSFPHTHTHSFSRFREGVR